MADDRIAGSRQVPHPLVQLRGTERTATFNSTRLRLPRGADLRLCGGACPSPLTLRTTHQGQGTGVLPLSDLLPLVFGTVLADLPSLLHHRALAPPRSSSFRSYRCGAKQGRWVRVFALLTSHLPQHSGRADRKTQSCPLAHLSGLSPYRRNNAPDRHHRHQVRKQSPTQSPMNSPLRPFPRPSRPSPVSNVGQFPNFQGRGDSVRPLPPPLSASTERVAIVPITLCWNENLLQHQWPKLRMTSHPRRFPRQTKACTRSFEGTPSLQPGQLPPTTPES
jgi:hypothetical protein